MRALAGAGRAPGDRDHSRPRRAGHLVALDESRARAGHAGAGGRLAAGQLPALLPRAVGTATPGASRARRASAWSAMPAPCHGTCPANIDIPSFIAHLGHGDYRATIEVIRRDNPLPLVCGLVCPAPCESACVRGGSNGAVFIRPMKAKAAEHCLAEGGYPQARDRARHRQAHRHRRLRPVQSDSGLLPAHLRPRGRDLRGAGAGRRACCATASRPIACRPTCSTRRSTQIRVLGIQIHTSTPSRQPRGLSQGLRRRVPRPGHAAGAPHPDRRCPSALRARRHRFPARRAQRRAGAGRGRGSSSSAAATSPIDVALTALRQGAQHVDMVSLEKRREMPASPHEIENAVAEGVQLHPGWGPLRIDEDGEITFQFCERTRDDGRASSIRSSTPSRLLTLDADQVILATGQGTDLAILEGSEVENNHGFIVADATTLMTRVPGVFAGGDAEHGPRTAVEAIRSGKIAAASIDAWLRGVPLDASIGQPVRRAEVVPLQVLAHDRTYLPRAVMPERSVEEVLGEGNYVRIEEGLTDAMAHDEAGAACAATVHRVRAVHGRPAARWAIEALRLGRHDGRPAGVLRLYAGGGTVHRLRGLHAGLPHRRDPPRGSGRSEAHRHYGNRRTGTAAAGLQRVRCADETPAHRAYVRDRLPDHMAALLDRESARRAHGYAPIVPYWQHSTRRRSHSFILQGGTHEGSHRQARGRGLSSLRGSPRT